MAEQLTLEAEKRTIKGKKVKSLRKKGILPAVLYGHGVKPLLLQVPYNDFKKAYEKAGSSSLINLVVDRQPYNVLIHEVEIEPLSQNFIHADFYQVKMTEKITAEVPLYFVGESKAVEEQDGVLVKNMDSVEVSCLPKDLPSHIEVDISVLENIDDSIHIKDLKVPEGVEILKDSEETVLTVTPPRTEEELAELEEEVTEEEEKEAVEQVEVETEKEETEEKKEETEESK